MFPGEITTARAIYEANRETGEPSTKTQNDHHNRLPYTMLPYFNAALKQCLSYSTPSPDALSRKSCAVKDEMAKANNK